MKSKLRTSRVTKTKLPGAGGKEYYVSGENLNENAKIPRTDDGKIIFSAGGVHPFLNTGHIIYTRDIVKAIPKLLEAGRKGTYTLPAPMEPQNYESTDSLSINSKLLKRSGTANDFTWKNSPMCRFSQEASFEFSFSGSYLGLYSLIGPESGIIEYSIDGKTAKHIMFDAYCHYDRLNLFSIPLPKDKDKIHKIKITVLKEYPDKGKILAAKKRDADFKKNPDHYSACSASFSRIFYIGEITP